MSETPTPEANRRLCLFASWKELAIVGLLVLHFLLGLVSVLPRQSKVWNLPALEHVGRFYETHRLGQRWNMFSPPPQHKRSIHFALQFPEGWTDLVELDGFASRQIKGVLIQPRGMFRLKAFLRASNRDSIPAGLSERSGRAFYYQQLTEYFCRGDGRIPGLIGIRFYLVGRTPPHFFGQGPYGQPLPPASDLDFQEPLYEQECSTS